jgi:hypothetical protein
LDWLSLLSERLRDVRVVSGDWSRVSDPSVTFLHGITGVFLDPPYSEKANRQSELYATGDLSVSNDAFKGICFK